MGVFTQLATFFYCVAGSFQRQKSVKDFRFHYDRYWPAGVGVWIDSSVDPSLGVLWVDYIEDYMGTARGTFINRNNFAAFINMIWPLALGLTLGTNGKMNSLKAILSSDRLNRHALMALGVIGFLLTLILTRSRAGIFSGIVGFMTFMIMSRTKKYWVAAQTRALLCGIIVLLSVYIIAIGVGPILERFLAVDVDGNFRMLIWEDSLSIIKDHPIGIGLRNYENVFSVYNQSFVSDKTVMYAHNDYLQLLIETGWVGFFTLIGGFIFFIGKSYRLVRRLDFNNDPFRFFLAVGAFSGIISLAFHSFFDFNLQIPANCLYFVTLIAILFPVPNMPRIPRVYDRPIIFRRIQSTWFLSLLQRNENIIDRFTLSTLRVDDRRPLKKIRNEVVDENSY